MKHLYCLTLLLFLTILAKAQDFRGGLIAGANFCQIDGDNHSGYNKAGIHFGFLINKPLSEKSSIQFEMLVSHKGSRLLFKDSTGAGPIPATVYRLNYVEVPFIYRYALKPKLKAEAGLSFAILYGNKADVGAGFQKADDIKRMDYLGNIGLCYNLSKRLLVNWRLQYSLTSITAREKAQNSRFIRNGVYNNVTSICLQYLFN